MPSSSWRVSRTPAASHRLPSWSRKLSAMSCSPFSIGLSWILRCFLISSGVWNWAGRPVSSCRKRTSWRRAAYTWLPVMRPPVLRHSSIARSTAQSECWELSTGTKISRYTDTSLSRAGRVCEPPNRLSSKPETESATAGLVGGLAGYQLPTFPVPHCYRVHRARLERVIPPRRDHPAHHFQGLGRQRRATDLHAERGNQLGLHRVREQRDHPAALGAAKRGRERAVAGKLALFERHLAVALDAQELH